MNWITRSRTWSRTVIFLGYLGIQFMSRSWPDHEVMIWSWTRALKMWSGGALFFAVSAAFFFEDFKNMVTKGTFTISPHFFFVDFKDMVAKGTFTISGGKTPSIQQGYVTTWGQTTSQSNIFGRKNSFFWRTVWLKPSNIVWRRHGGSGCSTPLEIFCMVCT